MILQQSASSTSPEGIGDELGEALLEEQQDGLAEELAAEAHQEDQLLEEQYDEQLQEQVEELAEEDSQRLNMSLDEVCWFARGSMKASFQRRQEEAEGEHLSWQEQGHAEGGENEYADGAHDGTTETDGAELPAPIQPGQFAPRQTLQLHPSVQRPPVKKATYWQRLRGMGGSSSTMPHQNNFYNTYGGFQSETVDESWGDWAPQDAENEPEEAAEDAQEEAQDDSSTLPDGSQLMCHPNGRLLVRTRGGTVKLISSSDGAAPAM